MSSNLKAVLRTPVTLGLAAAFCIYAALFRLKAALYHDGAPPTLEPLWAVWTIAGIVIAASIAIRSTSAADRIVFGVAATTLILRLATNFLWPGVPISPALNWIACLLWILAGLTSLALLLGLAGVATPSRKR
jgi:hypothetical protein